MIRFLSDPYIGYLSLALCIITTMTVEQALETIAPDPDADRKIIRAQEDEDLVKLKPEMTWKELGEIFNLKPQSAIMRFKRIQKRMKG